MVNVPTFTMGARLNDDIRASSQGLSNALAQWQARQLQQQQMAEQARQFGMQNMLAQAQFGLAQRAAARADELAPLQRAHLLAQNESLAAQSAFNRARARSLFAPPMVAAPAPAVDPTANLGMRPDGSVYEAGMDGLNGADGGDGSDRLGGFAQTAQNLPGVRRETRVLGAGSQTSPQMTREHMDFGPYGAGPSSVPGIVVGPQGKTDVYATQTAQGQRALSGMPDADRERAIRYMNIQRQWTALHGQKPRAGYMYDEQGREVPKGPLSAAASSNEQKEKGVQFALDELNAAEKTLLSGWAPEIGRTVAGGLKDLGGIGRTLNNWTGLEPKAEALGKVKGAVLQTVYALSGKQTTNKEMDNFLDQFMPLPGESNALVTSKMGRLRRFLNTLKSGVQKGMVYDDAERFAMTSAMRGAQTYSSSGSNQSSSGSDGWITLPGGERIREKR